MKNRHILGLTIGGVIWLTTVGTGFGTWSLLGIGTAAAKAGLVVMLTIATSLIVASALVITRLRRLPGGFGQNTPEGRAVGRQFAWTFAAEAVGCGVVSAWCIHERRFEWIVSLNDIVVGLHFFPLARIFRVPRYNVTALLFCVIPLVTLWAIPGGTRLGGTLALFAVPSLGCSVVSVLTAAACLREAWCFVALAARPF
jgi:hypothetical protein